MRRTSLFSACLLFLFGAVTARAQEKPALSPMEPTSGARMEFLDEVSFYEQRFERLADAVPAEKYSWRPVEGVRTVGEVYMHVATSNYAFAKMLGTAPPATYDAKALLASSNDKAKTIQALKDSFAYFRGAILTIKDSELDKQIKSRGETTIRGSFFMIAGHYGEHLGQSVAYARSLGVVPPWTEEQRQRQEAEKPKP